MAATVEDAAWIDDHARGVHFASDYALGLDLHAAPRKNYAVKASRDYDAVAFDLPFDFGAFAKDDSLFGDDISADVAVDAEGALKLKGALEGHALVNETGPLFTAAAL